MTAAGTSFSTAISALACECTVTTRAPAFEKAFAICKAIRGSSSHTRIEQPAKLVLFMVVSSGAAKRETARARGDLFMGRTVSRAVDQSSARNKRDDRLLKALVAS